jgi:hypothetical protein
MASRTLEQLGQAARNAASWNVIHRPTTKGSFPARLQVARNGLKLLEANLASLPLAVATEAESCRDSEPSPLLVLRENFRLLRSATTSLSESLRIVARLPRIVLDANRDEPRAVAVAEIYLRAVDGDFSEQTFSTFINELQIHESLTVEELWSVAGFLKFVLFELLLAEATTLLRGSEAARQPLISVFIKSLQIIGHSDWLSIVEPLILFDATLRQDPAEAYGLMDFESRDLYRRRVAFIARHSDYSESMVALTVLELAREAVNLPSDDPRIHRRRIHVGYYLIDKGLSQLAARTGYHPPLTDRVRTYIRAMAADFYIVSIEIISVLLIAAGLFPLLSRYSVASLAIAAALLLLPVMQDAVELVNSAVTTFFDPQPLPKLDFSKGIPAECATMVAVPALLLNEKQVRDLVSDLEVRFLANRDPHLPFALLTDLPDSLSKPHENDTDPLVELAVQLISELNVRYASPPSGGFLLLHRHRIFNTRQGVWMGWERKRGKLLDLNKLLVGEHDAFPIKAGPFEALGPIRYILTLDSDTQLPRGAAAQLIGAMAHPLNQAVIDAKTRIVTAGYGILQPRVSITVHSASRSRLAAIYSGQSGFDIYTRAVSDAYQDLFGEGSFTGKGIYEIAVFNAVLDRRFPRNALLSHDLIEGAYTRAGLATDIELIDDYPSHYSAYVRRKHRWVRGDWQIAQWMFSRVPEESGVWVTNPISVISRWKIFDNLRRSLVEPFTCILFVAGWLGLPGGPLYWTSVMFLLLAMPAFIVLGAGLFGAFATKRKGGVSEAFSGFGKALLVALIDVIFLPHQMLLSLDAIVRSLVRRFVTGKRLLEWETAAQSESYSPSRKLDHAYLAFIPLMTLGLAILVYLVAPRRDAIFFAAPTLLLWALAFAVTAWLNRPPREPHHRLGPADELFLRIHALRTWRYFYEFGSERHNFLIPDNVEEKELFEAARVSPTNLGLLLNARQAACELGFLTVPEYTALTSQTLATVEKLEKHRGHLYNWYNTESLEPLTPLAVSSVDSGNLLASVYTARAGALSLCQEPLVTLRLFAGVRTHWKLLELLDEPQAHLTRLTLPGITATLQEWIAWLPAADAALSEAAAANAGGSESLWWLAETRRRIASIQTLLHNYTPWLLPEYKSLGKLANLDFEQEGDTLSIDAAIAFCELLDVRLVSTKIAEESQLFALGEQLRSSLPQARLNLRALATDLRDLAHQIDALAEATDFSFLVDPERKMLSVGYDVAGQQLHAACYDMLASEARIAAFLAVARGDLPQQSWLKLGRGHTRVFGQFLLLSWTGTMFEYLMPALWMRSYPGTLIARTQSACVQVQRAFARSLKIPWGISESGFAQKDEAGHYQYHAFGIPQVALKFDAVAGPTVSPYSTFLALGVDSLEAIRNLRRMAESGWVGVYGFYEAADYSQSPETPVIVREWMAHHQGMSLLAILNLLHGNIVQHWFHSNPLVRSTELLLNELPASNAVLEAMAKEFTPFRTGASSAR